MVKKNRSERGLVNVNITGRPYIRDAVGKRGTAAERVYVGADRLLTEAIERWNRGAKVDSRVSSAQATIDIKRDTLEGMKRLAAQVTSKPLEKITNIEALEIAVRLAEVE